MTVKSHAKLEEKLVLCCDLCFEKLHEEFGKFSPEHSKVSKEAFLWSSFIQKRKCLSLNFKGELCYDDEEWCHICKGTDLSVQN